MALVYDFTSNVCGETAGSLHFISGITPERAKQVLNIDKGGGNPPLTYFMECVGSTGCCGCWQKPTKHM